MKLNEAFTPKAKKPGIGINQTKDKPNVGWLEPIRLRDKRLRIEAILRVIGVTDGKKYSLKIVKEDNASEYYDNYEQKLGITLEDQEIAELYKYLATCELVKDLPIGDRVLIVPLDGKDLNIGIHQPTEVAQAMLKALANPKIAGQFKTLSIPQNIAHILQLASRVQEIRAALDELRNLMARENQKETWYQEWIEKYSWALGTQYLQLSEVRRITRNQDVDGLAQTYTGFYDVIELKRPNFEVLSYDQNHKTHFFHKDVSATIGQLVNYLDEFHKAANSGLKDVEYIKACHPYGTIVIGRSNKWNENQHKALNALNAHLHHIRVITFDHLLEIGENLLKVVQQPPEDTPQSDELNDNLF